MDSLKKLWTFVKTYWSFIVLILASIVGYFLFKKNTISVAEQLEQIKKNHDEELKKIDSAREEERKAHEQNVKVLNETLQAVQKQYDEALQNLDSKKKKEIEAIVKQHKDDPDALAKKLSEATGFTVILPAR